MNYGLVVLGSMRRTNVQDGVDVIIRYRALRTESQQGQGAAPVAFKSSPLKYDLGEVVG